MGIFICTTPPAWGLDEQVHIARAYDISNGNMYPKALGDKGYYGANIPVSLINLIDHGHYESNTVDKSRYFFDRKDIRDPEKNVRLGNAQINEQNAKTYSFGQTGAYSPAIYAPASLGMLLSQKLDLSVGIMVNFARAFQAAMYIALCYTALRILKALKTKWLVFAIALLPTSLFQASIITADTFTIGVSILFFAYVVKLITQLNTISKLQLVWLLVITSLLMITKPSYAIFVLAITVIPQKLFASKRKALIAKAAIMTSSMIVLTTVSAIGVKYSDSMAIYLSPETFANINPVDQIKWIILNVVDFLQIMAKTILLNAQVWTNSIVGTLGYSAIITPYLFVTYTVLILAAISLYSKVVSKRVGAVFLLLGLSSAVLVIILLYANFNPVGATEILGVQGRYFIPCLPFILLGLATLAPIQVKMSDKSAGILFVSSSCVVLFVTVVVYIFSLY